MSHTGTPRIPRSNPLPLCCHRSSYTPIKDKDTEQMEERNPHLGVNKSKRASWAAQDKGSEGPTWLVFSMVLLGISAESLTKKLSNTSISQHSCLHTGHRIAPTGARDQIYYWKCQLRTTWLLFQTQSCEILSYDSVTNDIRLELLGGLRLVSLYH